MFCVLIWTTFIAADVVEINDLEKCRSSSATSF